MCLNVRVCEIEPVCDIYKKKVAQGKRGSKLPDDVKVNDRCTNRMRDEKR